MAEATAWVKGRYPPSLITHTSPLGPQSNCGYAQQVPGANYNPLCVCGCPDLPAGTCDDQPSEPYDCSMVNRAPHPCPDPPEPGNCVTNGPHCAQAGTSTPPNTGYQSGQMMKAGFPNGEQDTAPIMVKYAVDYQGNPQIFPGAIKNWTEVGQGTYPKTERSLSDYPPIAAGVFPFFNPNTNGNSCIGLNAFMRSNYGPDDSNPFDVAAEPHWRTGFTLYARTGQLGAGDGSLCGDQSAQQYDGIVMNFHASPVRKVISISGGDQQVGACSCLDSKLDDIPHQFIGVVTAAAYRYDQQPDPDAVAPVDQNTFDIAAPVAITLGTYAQQSTNPTVPLDPSARTRVQTNNTFRTSSGGSPCAYTPGGLSGRILKEQPWDISVSEVLPDDTLEVRPTAGSGSPAAYSADRDFCPGRIRSGISPVGAGQSILDVYDRQFGWYAGQGCDSFLVGKRPNDGLVITFGQPTNTTNQCCIGRVGRGSATGFGLPLLPESDPNFGNQPNNTTFGSIQQGRCINDRCDPNPPGSVSTPCWYFQPAQGLGPYWDQDYDDDPDEWPFNRDLCSSCSGNNPFTAYQSNNTNGDNPFVPVQPRSNAFSNIHDTRFFIDKYYGVDGDKVAPLNYLADKIVDGECVTMLCPNNNDSDNYCLQLQDCVL